MARYYEDGTPLQFDEEGQIVKKYNPDGSRMGAMSIEQSQDFEATQWMSKKPEINTNPNLGYSITDVPGNIVIDGKTWGILKGSGLDGQPRTIADWAMPDLEKLRQTGHIIEKDLPGFGKVWLQDALASDTFHALSEANESGPGSRAIVGAFLAGLGGITGLAAAGGGAATGGGAGLDSFVGSMDLMGGIGTPLGDAAAASAAQAGVTGAGISGGDIFDAIGENFTGSMDATGSTGTGLPGSGPATSNAAGGAAGTLEGTSLANNNPFTGSMDATGSTGTGLPGSGAATSNAAGGAAGTLAGTAAGGAGGVGSVLSTRRSVVINPLTKAIANYLVQNKLADNLEDAANKLMPLMDPLSHPKRQPYQNQLFDMIMGTNGGYKATPFYTGQKNMLDQSLQANLSKYGVGGTPFLNFSDQHQNLISRDFFNLANLNSQAGGFGHVANPAGAVNLLQGSANANATGLAGFGSVMTSGSGGKSPLESFVDALNNTKIFNP